MEQEPKSPERSVTPEAAPKRRPKAAARAPKPDPPSDALAHMMQMMQALSKNISSVTDSMNAVERRATKAEPLTQDASVLLDVLARTRARDPQKTLRLL